MLIFRVIFLTIQGEGACVGYMLLEFKVSNFRSFKEMAVLSLKASGSNEHPENLVSEAHGARALKSAVIYGPNAAGKSNLIKALVAAIMIVRTSVTRQIDSQIPFVEPFAFCDGGRKDSSFEFEFMLGSRRYVYGFSCTRKKVTEEHLVLYSSQRPTRVFSRKGEKYDFFNSNTARILDPLKERNTPNKLFLATATNWNADATKEAFMWFSRYIDVFDSQQPMLQSLELYEADRNGELRQFTTRLLKESDINISDYTVEARTVNMPSAPRGELVRSKEYKVVSRHDIRTDDGRRVAYDLQMSEESRGTQNLFFLSPQLKKALDNGYVFCVDELDSSMHPDLLQYLIGLFNSSDTNPHGAQLIVTLHSTEVMTLKLFRRDQILFVDKDNDTGVSELYSLDDFPVRLNEDVRKAYMAGRFGAVPDIV